MRQTTIFLIIAAGALQCWSQTADRLVLEGRNLLKAKQLTRANDKFREAVALNPTHDTARVLYATTRLLSLPDSRPWQDLMDRLGIGLTGRNLYAWTATFPTNREGEPVLPNQFSAAEAVGFLRTNLYPEISSSLEDMATVSDRFFLLPLSKEETFTTDVVIDYADLQMLRAILHATRGAILTVHAHNFDAQLNVVTSLRDAGLLDAESGLQLFPQLLATARPEDLPLARQELMRAAQRYQEASALIWQRPANVVRLFNFDPESKEDEAAFRDKVSSGLQSLDTPTEISFGTNSTDRAVVYAQPFFAGEVELRSLLPELKGSSFVPGTLPDPTLAGMLPEMDGKAYALEALLAQSMETSTYFEPPLVAQSRLHVRLPAAVRMSIEVSTNLKSWSRLGAFEPDHGVITFSLPLTSGPSLFLRARHD